MRGMRQRWGTAGTGLLTVVWLQHASSPNLAIAFNGIRNHRHDPLLPPPPSRLRCNCTCLRLHFLINHECNPPQALPGPAG